MVRRAQANLTSTFRWNRHNTWERRHPGGMHEIRIENFSRCAFPFAGWKPALPFALALFRLSYVRGRGAQKDFGGIDFA